MFFAYAYFQEKQKYIEELLDVNSHCQTSDHYIQSC